MNRTLLRPALTALALLALASTATAQDGAAYPSKTVTIVVPTPPAGGTDLIARLFADVLGRAFKQSVIVDNRAGEGEKGQCDECRPQQCPVHGSVSLGMGRAVPAPLGASPMAMGGGTASPC